MSSKNIVVAGTAGFCFGVNRAMDTVLSQANTGKKIFTLGSVVHNQYVISDLIQKGVTPVKSLDEVPAGSVLVIRAHGVPRNILEKAQEMNIKCVDATCPFVKKIHTIVERESRLGNCVLIAGDKNHPEVVGIKGHCESKSFVFNSLEELSSIIKSQELDMKSKISVVVQTTFNKQEWLKCDEYIKTNFSRWSVFNTICNATHLRQEEAEVLSKNSDLMLVVGDRKSSNTNKLYDICKQNCKTIFVETISDLNIDVVRLSKRIGITAGASTPLSLIKEVKELVEKIKE